MSITAALMISKIRGIARFVLSDKAATAVEYAVMLGIIVAALVAVTALGNASNSTFNRIADAMADNADDGGGFDICP